MRLTPRPAAIVETEMMLRVKVDGSAAGGDQAILRVIVSTRLWYT